MNERIQKELEILRKYFSKAEYVEDGQWVLIEDYPIPPDKPWNRQKTKVCFQILPGYPGAPPYGFYVPAGILCEGNPPNNYREPPDNKPPFPGEWGIFSWTQDSGWYPTADPNTGSNLLNFVRTFKDRFIKGR